MPIDIKEERGFELKFLDREQVLNLLDGGYSGVAAGFITGVSERYVTAFKANFFNRTAYRKQKAREKGMTLYEYHESLVRRRRNPETGEPFKSHTEYRDYLARQKINPHTGKSFRSNAELKRYQRNQRE